MKTFFKKLEYGFLVESTKIEEVSFPYKKLQYQKLILRKIEWWLQNGPITKSSVVPVLLYFFENFVSV